MPSASDFAPECNWTIYDWTLCTPQICCLAQGQIDYLPTLAGNALFAAIFGLLLLPQIFFGIRKKTWSFFFWMTLGLLAEVIGYVGRIELYENIFSFNAFLVYLIPLTIAPAFMTASIYLCLARLIFILDPKLIYSRLKPMTYTKIFVTFDFICLVLQGAGGGVAATAGYDKKMAHMGVHIMVAGLAFQVFSLVLFIILCTDFAVRLHRGDASNSITTSASVSEQPLRDIGEGSSRSETSARHNDYLSIRNSKSFRGFVCALTAATFFILTRSAYRLAELQEGFGGKLANNEVLFMIFEGPMVILAALALTTFHPGPSLRGMWSMKDFQSKTDGSAEKVSASGIA